MTVNQISIFIENRKGTLINVLEVLRKAGIQLITTTIADTVEYGIFRIICDRPEVACDALLEAGVPAVMSEVFALELDNVPGSAAAAIEIFAKAGIGINYLYSFLLAGQGIMIFSTDDPVKASEVITSNGLKSLRSDMLSRMAE